jgi:DNA-binding transcriptional LysR family regulator
MHLRKVDLNLLVALDTLLRERSVSRAAQTLHLSQSAMSHALGRLRGMMNDPLLVRGPAGLVPTLRAEQLRGPVRQALQALEDALDPREFDPAHITRTFCLLTTDYVEYLVCPPLVEQLREAAPGARIQIKALRSSRVHDELADGQADMAVSFAEHAEGKSHGHTLMTEGYACLTRSGLFGARPPTMAQYLAAPHIVVSTYGNFANAPDAALERLGHARTAVMTSPHYLAAAEMVCRSDLVLTIQSRFARQLASRLPVTACELPYEVPPIRLNLQWTDRTHNDAAQQWLRALIGEICESLAGGPEGPQRPRRADTFG